MQLQLDDIGLQYGSFAALQHVSLSLAKGEFLALLGPSGSGKSSLLRVVAGFAIPQQGSVRIAGDVVTGLPPRARNLGMVFQSYALFPHLTAAENVAFGLECRGVKRADLVQRVDRALALVGLESMPNRLPRQLSGGQQQRVALARALVIEPDILLLDESLGALDKALRVQMQTELKSLQRRLGVTTVFVTHDQEEAMAMADRIAILRDGRIMQIGTPVEVYRRPATTWVAEFIGSGNIITGRLADAGGGEYRVAGPKELDLRVRCDAPPAGPLSLFVRADRLDVRLAGDSPLRVVARRFLGASVEIHIDAGDHRLKAMVPLDQAEALQIGAMVHISSAAKDGSILRSGDEAMAA